MMLMALDTRQDLLFVGHDCYFEIMILNGLLWVMIIIWFVKNKVMISMLGKDMSIKGENHCYSS
jgi:hypothetical protein